MSALTVLIDNANKVFTEDEIRIFHEAAREAEAFITKHFTLDYPVDVVLTPPSSLMKTIPEDGITGRTYHSRHVVVAIDTKHAPINQDFIFETMCHEMSHSLRWEKLPEHANTLFDGMIMEGLAVALEEKALTDTGRVHIQFFLNEMQSTDQAMIDAITAQLKPDFDSQTYDYDTVFYSGNDTLPRWAGYRLGYYFVKKHLETTGTTINKATLANYKSFAS
ncbi:MAG: DUF2268 domain-containing putative Zn-dependent protease [Bradymonadales bacterium]